MKIIIYGAYAIGTHLAKLLSRNNHDTILIDDDDERLANITSDYDLMTVLASNRKIKTHEHLHDGKSAGSKAHRVKGGQL